MYTYVCIYTYVTFVRSQERPEPHHMYTYVCKYMYVTFLRSQERRPYPEPHRDRPLVPLEAQARLRHARHPGRVHQGDAPRRHAAAGQEVGIFRPPGE